MGMTIRSPLDWPADWTRSHQHSSSARFINLTHEKAFSSLEYELKRLGARHIVCTYNNGPDRHSDPAVAVFFLLNGAQMVMARDEFDTTPGNARSITLAIKALRQLERHGGGAMKNRAFAGFKALPSSKTPYDVLSVRPDATVEEINRQFRIKAAEAHPDKGGTDEAMALLNWARGEALKKARS
jgi:hypothetical protein